ncbi:hypothetical protein D3C71_1711100 [compost metagenome]
MGQIVRQAVPGEAGDVNRQLLTAAGIGHARQADADAALGVQLAIGMIDQLLDTGQKCAVIAGRRAHPLAQHLPQLAIVGRHFNLGAADVETVTHL